MLDLTKMTREEIKQMIRDIEQENYEYGVRIKELKAIYSLNEEIRDTLVMSMEIQTNLCDLNRKKDDLL